MIVIILGFTDLGANDPPEVLYTGNSVGEAREVLKAGAEGIVVAHLVVNPMVHQIKRYRTGRREAKAAIEKVAAEAGGAKKAGKKGEQTALTVVDDKGATGDLLAGETSVEETPAEETPAEETPAEETPAEETPAEEVPNEEVPAEEVPAEEVPNEEFPAEEVSAEEVPAGDLPLELPSKKKKK